MLYTILPHQRAQYASLLDAMFKHRNEVYETSSEMTIDDTSDDLDNNEAIYLVYSDAKEGIIGSARLNPLRPTDDFEELCGPLADQVLVNESWFCSFTIFHLSKSGENTNQPFQERWEKESRLKEAFYTSLRGALDSFGTTQRAANILCVNDPYIHEQMEEYSGRPFDLSILEKYQAFDDYGEREFGGPSHEAYWMAKYDRVFGLLNYIAHARPN